MHPTPLPPTPNHQPPNPCSLHPNSSPLPFRIQPCVGMTGVTLQTTLCRITGVTLHTTTCRTTGVSLHTTPCRMTAVTSHTTPCGMTGVTLHSHVYLCLERPCGRRAPPTARSANSIKILSTNRLISKHRSNYLLVQISRADGQPHLFGESVKANLEVLSLGQAQLEANQRAQMQIAVELRERAERAEAEVCESDSETDRARDSDSERE